MRLTFLGTCAGCEPMPDRHHTAFALEHDSDVYFVDAGETCSYTAHLAGIDLLATRAIFITHPHIDHVGGLANLLWTIGKLGGRVDPEALAQASPLVDVLISDHQVFEGAVELLGGTGFHHPHYDLQVQRPADGEVYASGEFRVTALHNEHMGTPESGALWQSFSYLVEAGDRRVLFSGDFRHVSELDSLLDGVDLVLVETGHHRVEDICEHLAPRDVPGVGFIHHGRAILADADAELTKARAILGKRVFFASDGMQLDLATVVGSA